MNERNFRSAKTPDAAVVLPVFGVLLLMPPAILLFAAQTTLWGIPLIVLYVFGVWSGLIVCAALLARRLGEPSMPAQPSSVGIDADDR